MVDPVFHPAGPQDRQTVRDLARRIWIPTFRPLFEERELHALYEGMYGPAAIDAIFSNPNYELFFLSAPGRGADWIGYVGIEWKADAVRLDKLYLDTHCRGRGFGGRVLHAVHQRAVGKRKAVIELRVNVANARAISFYRKHGFSVTDTVRIPGPLDYEYHDHLMEKTVDF